MTSSFALLLWSILDCDDYLEVLPDKLIDALLQYLTFRSKDLLHSEVNKPKIYIINHFLQYRSYAMK